MTQIQAFRNMSIRRKLMALTMLTSGVVLLLVTLAFVINETMTFRNAIRQELTALANIIGMNSTAAITFNDNKSAELTLEGLGSNPHILSAAIMTSNGTVFASYLARGASKSLMPEPSSQDEPREGSGDTLGESGAETKRWWNWDSDFEVKVPILLDNQLLGTVVIRAGSAELISRLKWFLIMVFFITIGALSVAYALSAKLQHPISDPILDLAHTVRTVSIEKNYSVRANEHGSDEIGQLIKGFNEMLEQIQERDMKLQIEITERKRAEEEILKLNAELELKVEKRTKQLVDAQEELVRKEKLAILGQLAGGVGHELRNPLGVINNAIYFLKTVMPDADETTKEYMDIIKDEVLSSERIISDLLDFARTKTPQKSLVTIGELITQSLKKCKVPENVTVEADIPETLPGVIVDPMQMGQVFQNLITNAVQAMPGGGSLEIRAEEDREANALKISVTDTGEGISPENMSKLFQPLFTTKARGIGLGLVVSKRLTEANGGRIEVESQLGKGTTFTVRLPIKGKDYA